MLGIENKYLLTAAGMVISAVILLGLAACGGENSANSSAIVVTEVFEFEGEQVIITRVFEPTATYTPTPLPVEDVDRLVEVDLGYVSNLPNLDPQQATTETGLDFHENLFAGLTNFNHETKRIEPELAEGWVVEDGGSSWTFQLRDDVYWVQQAGSAPPEGEPWAAEPIRPVTADDVVAAVQRACSSSPATPDVYVLFIIEGCRELNGIVEPAEEDLALLGVSAEDPTTVRFQLSEPSAYFLTISSMNLLKPIPPELVEEYGEEFRLINGDFSSGWQTPDNLITSGPFFPARNQLTDDGAVLWKNNLWPLETVGNAERVNIRFGQNDSELYADWVARELDWSPLPAANREDFLSRTPAKARLINDPTVFYLGLNWDSPTVGERGVRQALSAAIDRDVLVEDLFDNRAAAMRHFTPPDIFGAPPIDEVGVGYSPDYAIQRMASTSYFDCSVLPELNILVSTADNSLLLLETLRDMWEEELGCDPDVVNIDQAELGELLARTRPNAENRPDIWELAHVPLIPDAHNYFMGTLHCEGSENRAKRPCSEADRLIQQAAITPDPEERVRLYREVERLFFAEDGSFPIIPLYVRGDYTVVQSWLSYTPAATGGEQFDTYVIDEELKRLEQSRS